MLVIVVVAVRHKSTIEACNNDIELHHRFAIKTLLFIFILAQKGKTNNLRD